MTKVKKPNPVRVDFEGFKIARRPAYPPIPTSVSIQYPNKPPKFLCWGHRSGNNCTRGQAIAQLRKAWGWRDGVVFHNAKFDTDVAEIRMGMPVLPWDKVHDTVYMLFLDNPHSRNLGLKESAKAYLGIEPEERDAVADWLIANQPALKETGIRITKGKAAENPAGAYVALAPGALVGPYASGDVVRTGALFDHLWPSLAARGMLEAYDRERRLMPILLQTERDGVRVAHKRLRDDVTMYRDVLDQIDVWIRKRLGNPVTVDKKNQNKLVPINLDSGAQLAEALFAAKAADPDLMLMTKGGAVSTAKDSIKAGVTDRILGAVIQYRSQLKTCLNTFMETWLEMADASGGFIFTNWNQTKNDRDAGTRTGRLSSTPNFQNMPKEFAPLFAHEADREEDPAKQKALLKIKAPIKLPPLPLCRSYIVAYQDNHVLVGRDYSQQEPRILGHFEGGDLMRQYQENPWIDYHDNAKENLERVMGRPYKRKPVKNINLGIIYGQGVPSLAEKNGSSVAETKEIRDAIYAMYPGLKEMYNDMKFRARNNLSIRTWGGREYYCEPPIFLNGRKIEFDYKMVNVLVQGSAADCTKEALIRFVDRYAKRMHNRGWKVLLQVHDEIVISVPAEDLDEAQEALRLCMESVEFDVQILSEGAWSNDNWAVMKDYDKKGKRCAA